MANGRRIDYGGMWILIACLVVAAIAVEPQSPYRGWVNQILGVEQAGDSAQGYLAKRVAVGVSAGSGLLAILLLAAFTWRRYWYWTFMGVYPALMLLLHPIVYAAALLWGSIKLIEPTQAKLLLYDNALEDRSFWIAFSLTTAIAICCAAATALWQLRSKRANAAQACVVADSSN